MNENDYKDSNHFKRVTANEIARLSALALLHRAAAPTGEGFEYGTYTYKGDAAWHLKCAATLEKAAANLSRALATI